MHEFGAEKAHFDLKARRWLKRVRAPAMRGLWTLWGPVKLRPKVLKSTQERLSDHWVASGLQEDVREVDMISEAKKHILTSQLGHGQSVHALRLCAVSGLCRAW